MGSLTKLIGAALVERYCDECQNYCETPCSGGKGSCAALNRLIKEVGAPVAPVVYGRFRADKCKFFSPLEFVDYVERAVTAGEVLDGAA